MARQKRKIEHGNTGHLPIPMLDAQHIHAKREGDKVIVSVAVNFYRRNGRQMIIADSGEMTDENNSSPRDRSCNSSADVAAHSNTTLLTAIAKAYQWQEQLESGQFDTIEDLADSKKVCRGFAARIMRLTSLSPDIIELIMRGEESQNLSLRQLRKGIPDCWRQQLGLVNGVAYEERQ